ncbi:hypothetical protein EDM56_24785, partial [Brevibacillus fluminis]
MNYPYSKKGWMALTLAAVMLTSVGVAKADSDKTNDSQQATVSNPFASTEQKATTNTAAKPVATPATTPATATATTTTTT